TAGFVSSTSTVRPERSGTRFSRALSSTPHRTASAGTVRPQPRVPPVVPWSPSRQLAVLLLLRAAQPKLTVPERRADEVAVVWQIVARVRVRRRETQCAAHL